MGEINDADVLCLAADADAVSAMDAFVGILFDGFAGEVNLIFVLVRFLRLVESHLCDAKTIGQPLQGALVATDTGGAFSAVGR